MSSEGIMRAARRLIFVLGVAILVPAVFAQSPPARKSDDLDVTMRVIVDPDAKVPDEIVRRIPLPKPAPAAPPAGDPAQDKGKDKNKSNEPGKPVDPGAAGEKGREFGQQVADQAKQRSEEARRNNKAADPPGNPRGPPDNPMGPPDNPMGPPPRPGG